MRDPDRLTRQTMGIEDGIPLEATGSDIAGLRRDIQRLMDIGNFLQGSLLYWDRYVKEGGRWLIRETRYERLYEINEPLLKAPNLSSHYLGVHGAP